MSCIAARTMLLYVRERLGSDAAREVARATGLAEEYLTDESHWMSFAAAQAMSERCQELFGDPMVPFLMGQWSASLGTVGPLVAMARSMGTPRAAFKYSPRFNRQFTRVVEMAVPDLSEGRALVHAAYQGVVPHRNDCLYRQGVLSGIPILWGLPPASIEELSCAASGDDRCSYFLKWRPLSRSAPLLAAMFLGSGLATVHIMRRHPRAATILAPLAIATLSLLGLRLDRRVRRERETSREEFGALETQLKHVEAKGDELQTAKAALEDRVAALDGALAHAREVSATLDAAEISGTTLARLQEVAGGAGGLLVAGGDGDARVLATSGAAPAGLIGAAVGPSPVEPEDLVAWARARGVLPGGRQPVIEELRVGGRWRGAALIAVPGELGISPRVCEVTSLLAAQAAIALENARLYELAITDGLTGLFIHRHFNQQLEHEISRVERYRGSFALLMLDLDHFKLLNDQHGHLMGDRVLREVADVLRRSLRAQLDIVARYGGEELAVILPETDQAGAATVAEKLRAEVAALRWSSGGEPVSVTTSIGFTVHSGDRVPAHDLIHRADDALYQAKRAGRNRVAAG